MTEPNTDDTAPTDDTTPTDDVPEWLSLDEGEEIRWQGQPVMASMIGTAVAGLLTAVLLIGLLILLTLPLTYVSRKNTEYVVTNQSLYVKTGVLGTNIESVGVEKIQNTEFSQSFWGKKFGYGSLEISTAGSSGAETSFDNIPDAREVRDLVSGLGGDAGAAATAGAASAAESGGTAGGETTAGGADLDELVAELRATREALERVEAKMDDPEAETETE
jgi:membrane protein YdbS with pleckstrin-like domain